MHMSHRRWLPRVLVILSLFVWLVAMPVQAQAQGGTWSGVCVASDIGYDDVATIQGVQCLIANILSVAISLIGMAGFVMMLIGSFRYIISGGNSKGADAARNTITFAVVGLAVALSAFIVLNLIAAFTGVQTIKVFQIPNSSTGL